VRAGLAGAVAAVTALCAIAVFGASLSHLLTSPELYGDPYPAFVNAGGPAAPSAASLVSELRRDPAVDRITLVTAPAISIGTVYPGWLLAAIAGGFLLATLAIAVLPARTATRARTSQLLRAE
jgi:hypothetical protein